MSSIVVAMEMGYILSCYVERIRNNWRKKKEHDNKEYTLFLVPFLLFYIIVLVFLPTKEEPYMLETVQEMYHNLKEKAIIWAENRNRNGAEDFGFLTAGFSDDGKLGGGFLKEDKNLMRIQGDISMVTNLYLRGKTYDTFNGKEWTKSLEEDRKEYPLDTMETIYAIRRYDPEWETNYIRIENCTIRYEYFNTGYLFTPLKLAKVKDIEYETSGRDFRFEEQKGYATEYGLRYYQLNLGQPEFEKLFDAALTEDENVWKNVVMNTGAVLSEFPKLKDLEKYRQDMKTDYLQEIVLSKEVQEYLENITKRAENPYQRMKAIEKELSSYTYTTNPGRLPMRIRSQEAFLDYFMLDSKQGYCSYFATAFVLLARAEGLPARYVEGFMIPVTEERVMDVSSSRAHAWPEVYFEGIGWIAFEPTPGYGTYYYDGWELKKPLEDKDTTGKEQATPIPEATEEPIEEIEPVEEEQHNSERELLIIRGILVIFAICAIILLLEKKWCERRYQHMNSKEKFLVEVKRNLWVLARLGCEREETETISELYTRICEVFPELMERKGEFVFLTIYEEYLYREDVVTMEAVNKTIGEREEVLEWLKEDNRWYYYFLLFRMAISFTGPAFFN